MNKLRIAIIVVLFQITISVLLGQVQYGVYKIEYAQENDMCVIYLTLEDFNYSLELVDYTNEDLVLSWNLSCGTYNQQNDTLFLLDSFYGFEMTFCQKKELLLCLQGIAPLQNNKAVYIGENHSQVPLYPNHLLLKKCKKRILDFSNRNKLYRMTFGQYRYDDFTLILQENKKYFFLYKNILLSEGYWNSQKKILFLNDSLLGKKFSLLIGYDELLSIKLIGGYGGYLFKKEDFCDFKTRFSMRSKGFGCSRRK